MAVEDEKVAQQGRRRSAGRRDGAAEAWATAPNGNTMNGRIWVESTPGVGSTFHVEIPQARASRRRRPPARRRTASKQEPA